MSAKPRLRGAGFQPSASPSSGCGPRSSDAWHSCGSAFAQARLHPAARSPRKVRCQRLNPDRFHGRQRRAQVQRQQPFHFAHCAALDHGDEPRIAHLVQFGPRWRQGHPAHRRRWPARTPALPLRNDRPTACRLLPAPPVPAQCADCQTVLSERHHQRSLGKFCVKHVRAFMLQSFAPAITDRPRYVRHRRQPFLQHFEIQSRATGNHRYLAAVPGRFNLGSRRFKPSACRPGFAGGCAPEQPVRNRCLVCRDGRDVSTSSSAYNCMASALITTPFRRSAMATATDDLPLAVGPAIRMAVFN